MNCNNKWDVVILEVNIFIKYDPAAVKDYTYKTFYVVYYWYFAQQYCHKFVILLVGRMIWRIHHELQLRQSRRTPICY